MKKSQERTPEGNQFTDIVLEVIRVQGMLSQFGEELTSRFDQTPGNWKILGPLNGQSLTVPQIARRMGLTRQGVQKSVNKLVKEGFIKFTDNIDHASSKLLQLTAKGEKVLGKISAGQAIWANEKGKQLTQAQLKKLLTDLQSFRAVLED